MRFVKMHGAGNDFVMIDNWEGKISLSPEQIVRLCDRHFGVGADAVIFVEKGRHGEDAFMNYWNNDGTLAEMCGNGMRCTAHFMQLYRGFTGKQLRVDTRGGEKIIDVLGKDLFRVNMGAPIFAPHKDFPDRPVTFASYEFRCVSMGNPHAVTIVSSEDIATKILRELAPGIEVDRSHFPNRINVHMAWKKGSHHYGAKTHERGCGPTLACGTGMSAVFAILTKHGEVGAHEKVQVDMPGGTLFFEYNAQGQILMTGPSAVVFSGEIQ